MRAGASPSYPLQVIAALAADMHGTGASDALGVLLNVCQEAKAKVGMAETFRKMLSSNADARLQAGALFSHCQG